MRCPLPAAGCCERPNPGSLASLQQPQAATAAAVRHSTLQPQRQQQWQHKFHWQQQQRVCVGGAAAHCWSHKLWRARHGPGGQAAVGGNHAAALVTRGAQRQHTAWEARWVMDCWVCGWSQWLVKQKYKAMPVLSDMRGRGVASITATGVKVSFHWLHNMLTDLPCRAVHAMLGLSCCCADAEILLTAPSRADIPVCLQHLHSFQLPSRHKC